MLAKAVWYCTQVQDLKTVDYPFRTAAVPLLTQLKLHCMKNSEQENTLLHSNVQKRFSLAQKFLQQNSSLLHPEMTIGDQQPFVCKKSHNQKIERQTPHLLFFVLSCMLITAINQFVQLVSETRLDTHGNQGLTQNLTAVGKLVSMLHREKRGQIIKLFT